MPVLGYPDYPAAQIKTPTHSNRLALQSTEDTISRQCYEAMTHSIQNRYRFLVISIVIIPPSVSVVFNH
jgi:hypothetical protein